MTDQWWFPVLIIGGISLYVVIGFVLVGYLDELAGLRDEVCFEDVAAALFWPFVILFAFVTSVVIWVYRLGRKLGKG